MQAQKNPPETGGLSRDRTSRRNPNSCSTPDCTSRAPIFLCATIEDRNLKLYFRPRCKRWDCPYCGKVNALLWRALIAEGAAYQLEQSRTLSFTTLTLSPKLTAAAGMKISGRMWDKLRRRASRASGGFEYVMIAERHKSGRLHWHMLDTAGLSTRWWKDNAPSCGFGFMVESEFARTVGGAARYATKYLTKSLETPWPKGFRRLRKSQGFLNTSAWEPPVGAEYEKVPEGESLWQHMRRNELEGWNVRLVGARAAGEALWKDQAPL